MWAGTGEDSLGPHFRHIAPDKRYAQMYGVADPVQVDVAEDPEGRYYGWIYSPDHDALMGRDHKPIPQMIQQHKVLFRVQFPYGVEAEENAGKGHAVRLRVEPVQSD